MKEIELRFSYDGGVASESKLDIYDAGVSIHGLSRALAITTHAFITKGILRKRAERTAGAKIYIHPPKHGSFLEIVTIVFTSEAAQAIGYSVAAAAFWDFLKWTWSKAIGSNHEPTTPYVKRIEAENETFSGAIATSLESSLEELHRPIASDHRITITVQRPRVGNILTLDKNSLDYVSTRSELELEENILGNVTKYNILSGYGRFYDDYAGKTIPFDIIPNLTGAQKRLLTWSMDQRSQDKDGKLHIDVIRVVNARNELKRYTITDARIATLTS